MVHPESESYFFMEEATTPEKLEGQRLLLNPDSIKQPGEYFSNLESRSLYDQPFDKEEIRRRLNEITGDRPEIVQTAVDFFERYFDKTKTVMDYVVQYQEQYCENWQNKFFEDNFSQPPAGKIEILVKPPMIYWRCYSLEDFILISGFEKDAAAQMFGAVRPPAFDQLPGLEGLNVAENASHPEYNPGTEIGERKSQLAQVHERQHIKFSFSRNLHERLEGIQDYAALDLKDISPESSAETIEQEIKNYFKFRFQEALVGAKNELLAYLTDGEKSLQEIKAFLLEEGGVYDPAASLDASLFLDGYFKERFGDQALDKVNRDNLISYCQDLYSQYRRTIERLIDGLTRINFGEGEQRTKMVNILSLASLTQWPEVAKTL